MPIRKRYLIIYKYSKGDIDFHCRHSDSMRTQLIDLSQRMDTNANKLQTHCLSTVQLRCIQHWVFSRTSHPLKPWWGRIGLPSDSWEQPSAATIPPPALNYGIQHCKRGLIYCWGHIGELAPPSVCMTLLALLAVIHLPLFTTTTGSGRIKSTDSHINFARYFKSD